MKQDLRYRAVRTQCCTAQIADRNVMGEDGYTKEEPYCTNCGDSYPLPIKCDISGKLTVPGCGCGACTRVSTALDAEQEVLA